MNRHLTLSPVGGNFHNSKLPYDTSLGHSTGAELHNISVSFGSQSGYKS